ncbi:MAG: protein phosphatase [Pseudohongiellaceae bacterium]|jgi:protein phosphatase
MIQFFGGTHKGNRKHNEDCFTANNELGLGLVADGMGGYACGEVASALVKETLVDALIHQQGLTEAIVRAHYLIRSESSADIGKKGMGSTVVAAKAQGNRYEIAWVGDSRAYLWDGALKQITRDHSYVESLLVAGTISLDEAKNHPNRNLITQAVGAAGEGGLEVSVVNGSLAPGEKLLLCSDGLIDEVDDVIIANMLNEGDSSTLLIDDLLQKALNAGGRDNITVVIAEADAVMMDEVSSVEQPFVICTTQLNGQTRRHAISEEPISPLETGLAIETDSPDEVLMGKSNAQQNTVYRAGIVVAVLLLIVIAVMSI